MDIKQIKWILCCMVLSVLCSCNEEWDSMHGRKDRAGIPVRFTAEWPTDGNAENTRAIADKREFEEGDVIQVSAVFTLIPDSESGTAVTETKYAALTLENGEWVNKMTTDLDYDMEWPWNAKEAEFTAYYMKEWNGPITEANVPVVVLDRFEYENYTANPDPLEAKSGKVEYGHAVKLEFKHLCTRLTITDVGDEDEYELRFKPSPDSDVSLLQNACTMVRDNDNKLNFSFVEEKSGKVSSQVDEENNRSVTFHLAPGDYSTFRLTRRNGYSYLTISNVEELKDLKAHNAYTVSLENLKGNITQDDMDDDWWNEQKPTPEEYEDFSVQAFMDAIYNCKGDYTCTIEGSTEPITLLEKDPYRKEMRLMADVDFKGETNYVPVDLPNLVTFDGGGKSILNIALPLFNNLYGTVTELNLWNAELIHKDIDPDIDPDAEHDTGWGVLARVCDEGKISNVRLIDANIEITLHNNVNENMTYCVGALVGNMKKGTIEDVLVDKIDITVQAQNTDALYTSCVGGVVGQCIGTMENIDNVGNASIKVSNNCIGNGTHYTGGVVGLFAGGVISDCELSTVVSAENAKGKWNYAGGVAGAVRGGGAIVRATVSGNVVGGEAIIYGKNESHSSTGGIVGHVQDASVTDGATTSSVNISTDYNGGDLLYYTIGGVIGSMNKGDIRKNEGRSEFDPTLYNGAHYVAGRFSGNGYEKTLIDNQNTADGKNGSFVGYDGEWK